MKIGHPADKSPPAAVTNGHASANGASHAAQARNVPAAADASARIELSSTAATLLATPASAEFDAEKVARISRSIADGSFKIDPEAIADRLIANAKELLTKVQP